MVISNCRRYEKQTVVILKVYLVDNFKQKK